MVHIEGQKEKDWLRMGLKNNSKTNIKGKQADEIEKVLNIGKLLINAIGTGSADLENERHFMIFTVIVVTRNGIRGLQLSCLKIIHTSI